MSFKDKPLKKIKADKRITIDAIHNNIIDNFKSDNVNHEKDIDNLNILESEYDLNPSNNLYNQIFLLKKKINKNDNLDNQKIDYYFNTSDILNDYYSNKNILKNNNEINVLDIMNNMCNQNQNQNQNQNPNQNQNQNQNPNPNIINDFFNIVDDDYKIDNLINKNDICENCNIPFKIKNNECLLFCEKCGLIKNILLNLEKIQYKDSNRETTYFAYKRINHFNEWLAQFQAKETTDIPQAIYSGIFQELKKLKITNYKNIDYKLIRSILKKLNFNKYYEHIPHIINIINGNKAPLLSRKHEEQLRMMFKEIQTPFMKFCPDDRKNFLSYSYVLHKFCELIELDELLIYFPLLKSREKLQQQDFIWKKICNYLKWQYIPSV